MSIRSVSTVLACLGVLSFVRVASAAQCPGWDRRFALQGPDAKVLASIVFDDGTGPALYVGGEFTHVGPIAVGFVGRWDGTSWSALGAGLDGPVTCLTSFDDGSGARLYAGGRFTSAGGATAARIARWDGAAWSSVGLGFDAEVRALCSFDDGSGPKLHAGGAFMASGATSALHVARWDGARWSGLAGGASGPVNALCVHAGTLRVGGDFQSVGGLAVRCIADWDGQGWGAMGSGCNAPVNALLSNGTELVAGGAFTEAGGVSTSRTARWNGTSWSASPVFYSEPVNALAWYPSLSTLYVGADGAHGPCLYRITGSTWHAVVDNDTSTVHTLSVFDGGTGPQLVFGGSLSPTIAPNLGAYDVASLGPLQPSLAVVGDVMTVAVHDDGSGPGPALYVAERGLPRLWKWTGAASLSLMPAYPNYVQVEALLSHDDGTGAALYAAGSSVPTTIGPIYRWNGSAWSSVGSGTNGTVYALTTFDDGTGPALYAGGAFTTAGPGGSVVCNGIARWTGSAWSPLGTGVRYGTVAGVVTTLVVHDDGTGPALYAGGTFTDAGGVAVGGVARWDGSAWSAVGIGMFGVGNGVHALKSWTTPSGSRELAVAGDFTSADGQPVRNVARWNGTSWIEMGPSSANDGSVDALATYDDGGGGGEELFASGLFASIGGTTASSIARWDGVRWNALDESVSVGTYGVETMTTYAPPSGGRRILVVGGRISATAGYPVGNLTAWTGCDATSFCAGDGVDAHVTTSCPCGNVGGVGRGCAWSGNASGALLQASGDLASDQLVLTASGMSAVAPSTIFLKGDALIPHGVVFGDGVRCVGGSLIRLGTKTNVAGSAQYPEAGNASISVRGMTPIGSGAIGYYQTYYRNAASFCTSATFNVTNGVRVVW